MPTTQERIAIGVALPTPDDIREWLADGAAFDAAGAHALWLDLSDLKRFDPFVLVSAMAAVTYRALLVVDAPTHGSPAGERAWETLALVSGGRLVRISPDGGPGTMRRSHEEADSFVETASAEQADDATAPRRWEVVDVPAGRAAWRTALADAAERGTAGLVVPAYPGLLDLLRNPDADIDRPDLHLAHG